VSSCGAIPAMLMTVGNCENVYVVLLGFQRVLLMCREKNRPVEAQKIESLLAMDAKLKCWIVDVRDVGLCCFLLCQRHVDLCLRQAM
jgi:hypothetical protein